MKAQIQFLILTLLATVQPGPGNFVARRRKRRQDRKDKRAESRRGNSSKKGGPQPAQNKIERWQQHPIVGGLIPLNSAGSYACPPLIVAGRAAVGLLLSCPISSLILSKLEVLHWKTHFKIDSLIKSVTILV